MRCTWGGKHVGAIVPDKTPLSSCWDSAHAPSVQPWPIWLSTSTLEPSGAKPVYCRVTKKRFSSERPSVMHQSRSAIQNCDSMVLLGKDRSWFTVGPSRRLIMDTSGAGIHTLETNPTSLSWFPCQRLCGPEDAEPLKSLRWLCRISALSSCFTNMKRGGSDTQLKSTLSPAKI